MLALILLELLLVLRGRLRIPASVLGLHLALLCPGLGRRGSRLRPVVPRLLGQQLRDEPLINLLCESTYQQTLEDIRECCRQSIVYSDSVSYWSFDIGHAENYAD